MKKLQHAQRNLKKRGALLLSLLLIFMMVGGPVMQAAAAEGIEPTAVTEEIPSIEESADPIEEPDPTPTPEPSVESEPEVEPAPEASVEPTPVPETSSEPESDAIVEAPDANTVLGGENPTAVSVQFTGYSNEAYTNSNETSVSSFPYSLQPLVSSTQSGQKFLGWKLENSEDASFVTELTADMAANGPIQLFAFFGEPEETFTVNFVDEDDSLIVAQPVVKDAAAVLPTLEEKDGKKFDRWELTPETASLDSVTMEITAKAVYKTAHTVTFLQPDGTVIDVQTLGQGEKIVSPDPSGIAGNAGINQHYRFLYWTGETRNVKVNVPETMGDKDLEFTAKYSNFPTDKADLYVDGVNVGSVYLTESFLKSMLDSGASGTYTGGGAYPLQPLVWLNNSDLNADRLFGVSGSSIIFDSENQLFKDAGFTFQTDLRSTRINEIAWEYVEYTATPGENWKICATLEQEKQESTVTYVIDPSLQDTYYLSNAGGGQLSDGVTHVGGLNQDGKITNFGVVLTQQGNKTGIVRAVTMTLLDSVTDSKGKVYPAGTIISTVNDAGNATPYGPAGFGFSVFSQQGTAIRLEVSALKHTVTFLAEDGKTVVGNPQNILHGHYPTAPAAPEVADKDFLGWTLDGESLADPAAVSVTGDLTYTALYDWQQYTVNYYLDEELQGDYVLKNNGSAVYTKKLNANQRTTGFDVFLKAKNEKPSRYVKAVSMSMMNAVTGEHRSWSGSTPVTYEAGEVISVLDGNGDAKPYTEKNFGYAYFKGNTVINIKVSAVAYTVTFRGGENGDTLVSTQQIIHGMSATAPEDTLVPEIPGMTFTGRWDTEFTNIVSDLTVKALYNPNGVYQLTFLDADGSTLHSESVTAGLKVQAPNAEENHPGYTFTGWTDEDGKTASIPETMPKSNLIFRATYTLNAATAELQVNGAKAGAVNLTNAFQKYAAENQLWKGYTGGNEAYTLEPLVGTTGIAASLTGSLDTSSFPESLRGLEDLELVNSYIDWLDAAPNADGTWIIRGELKEGTNFNVTFIANETTLKTENVRKGQSATAPVAAELPQVPGRYFLAWDTDFTNVTSDLTVTAIYQTISVPVGPVEEPDVPDVPDIPDVPDVSDTPDTPDTPVVPDVPVTPDVPNTPDTPAAPDAPAAVPDNTPEEAAVTPTTTTPAAPAAVPATVTIPDDPVPLAGGNTETGELDDGYTLTTIEDDPVPLAGGQDAHRYCILHFLILLTALVLELFYVVSRNRNQRRLHELRKELEQ